MRMSHQKILLILLASLYFTKQARTNRIREFFITTFQNGSVDTTKPLSNQLNTAGIIKQSKYKGTFMISGTIKDSEKLTARISYRENGEQESPINTTKVLIMSFPYKTDRKYLKKHLVYSSQPATKKEFRLSKKGLSHFLIEQVLHLWSGEDLKSDFELQNLLIKTGFDLTKIAADELSYPNFEQFELYFTQGASPNIF